MSTKLETAAYVRPRHLFIDEETLKKEEWKRRRLLRIEQVRQQSKDIASLVRQKVQIERGKQLGLVRQRVEAKIQRQKFRRLKALDSEFKTTLQNVGKGHAEAANQPNEELARVAQMARIIDAAQRRGQEALASLREEENVRRKADEERRALQQQVRTLEDSRSAAIVALPIPDTTVKAKSPPPKKIVSISVPSLKNSRTVSNGQESKGDVPAWPKKSWCQSVLPLGVSSSVRQEEFSSVMNNGNVAAGDTLSNVTVLRQGSSTHTVSQTQDIEKRKQPEYQEGLKSSRTSTMRNNEPSTEVKLYDHRNMYENQYSEPRSLAEKIEFGDEIDARQAAEKEQYDKESLQKTNLTLTHREHQRNQQALKRVQIQRDYKQLMASLSLIAKQKASLCASQAPSEVFEDADQERRKVTAVEDLLQGPDIEIVGDASPKSPDGTLLVSRLDETPGSIPKLNVGRREHIMQTPVVSTSSPAESIVLASPVTVPHPDIARPSNSSLRSLLQRINQGRNELLHSEEIQLPHSLVKQSIEQSKQQEVEMLSEKVKQQRQQLEEQHSEVQRLNASIIHPECMERINQDSNIAPAVGSSSRTHEIDDLESLVTDGSNESDVHVSQASKEDSTISHDVSASERGFEEVGGLTDDQTIKEMNSSKKTRERNHGSPSKESIVYSMDVSVSSVVMDHSTTSTSGSQSVSVHGVQVLVKVSGADEESSPSSSQSNRMDSYQERKKHSFHPRNESSFEYIKSKSILESAEHRKLHFQTCPDGESSKTKMKSHKPRKKEPDSHSIKVHSIRPSVKTSSKWSQNEEKNNHGEKGLRTKSDANQRDKYGSKAQTVRSSTNKTQSLRPQLDEKLEKLKFQVDENNKNTKDAPQSQLQEELTSASTSYFSPPERVLSSLSKDIETLLALAQSSTPARGSTLLKRKKKINQNPMLLKYISRLLSMSRESIDKLQIECSDVSTPPSGIFHSSGTDIGTGLDGDESTISGNIPSKETPQNVGKLHSSETTDVQDYAAPVHRSIDDDSFTPQVQRSDGCHFNSANLGENNLSDLTKQCHDKISALTKMIEEVRRQEIFDSRENRDTQRDAEAQSPLLLDSTGYLSPPPEVHEWTDIAMPYERKSEIDGKEEFDPYTSAVMKLLAEVRSEMCAQASGSHEAGIGPFSSPQGFGKKSQKNDGMAQARPRPPVAFWRNLDRCNMISPSEPHELSTIPELGATLPDSSGSTSPIPTLSPPADPGTPPDVIAELLRRKILTSPFSWAKELCKESFGNKKPSMSPNDSSKISLKNSRESELSSSNSGTGKSDISASKETNTVSFKSQLSSSHSSSDLKTNIILSPVDLYSSTDEVEGDFRRLGIGWVGAMLRKSKEAGALSSSSSSDGTALMVWNKAASDDTNDKDVCDVVDDDFILSSSLVPSHQGRGHSTPVKLPSGSNVSRPSGVG